MLQAEQFGPEICPAYYLASTVLLKGPCIRTYRLCKGAAQGGGGGPGPHRSFP
jgi:hypothetical protein